MSLPTHPQWLSAYCFGTRESDTDCSGQAGNEAGSRLRFTFQLPVTLIHPVQSSEGFLEAPKGFGAHNNFIFHSPANLMSWTWSGPSFNLYHCSSCATVSRGVLGAGHWWLPKSWGVVLTEDGDLPSCGKDSVKEWLQLGFSESTCRCSVQIHKRWLFHSLTLVTKKPNAWTS